MTEEKKKRYYPKNRKHTKARQLTEFSMKWRPPEEEDSSHGGGGISTSAFIILR